MNAYCATILVSVILLFRDNQEIPSFKCKNGEGCTSKIRAMILKP